MTKKIKKLKNKWYKFEAKAMLTLSLSKEEKKPSRPEDKLIPFMVGIMLFFQSTAITYAESTFFSKLKGGLETIYSELFALSTILAAVAGLIGLLIIMISFSDHKASKWFDFLKKVVIAYIAINAMKWVIDFFADITKGGQFTV